MALGIRWHWARKQIIQNYFLIATRSILSLKVKIAMLEDMNIFCHQLTSPLLVSGSGRWVTIFFLLAPNGVWCWLALDGTHKWVIFLSLTTFFFLIHPFPPLYNLLRYVLFSLQSVLFYFGGTCLFVCFKSAKSSHFYWEFLTIFRQIPIPPHHPFIDLIEIGKEINDFY